MEKLVKGMKIKMTTFNPDPFFEGIYNGTRIYEVIRVNKNTYTLNVIESTLDEREIGHHIKMDNNTPYKTVSLCGTQCVREIIK